MASDVVNEQVVHVCALQRSGHHAVIQWIMINSGRRVCFLNNCTPGTNPFESALLTGSLVPGIDLAAEQNGGLSPKALVICNYEDQRLDAVFAPGVGQTMQRWIGTSALVNHVLILRDPFNLIASKYRWAREGRWHQPSLDSLSQLPELWKAHARAFLNHRACEQTPLTTVNYNRWFSDGGYRHDLATTLAISTRDEGRDLVARWGPNTWGDSFDNLTYDGRATEMKVLERWKHYARDPFYRTLVQDDELVELSTRIFGPLPGAELLVD
jgi:hypothetical protein